MSDVVFRPGWTPTPPGRPRVRMTDSLRGEVAPASVNYGAVPTIGMHLNDQWGDCTCAADANIVQQQTCLGQGTEAVVADSEVLKAYEAVGNFDPSQGGPGNNPTDQGAQVPDALGYLQKTGMLGSDGQVHKIAGYGQIDVTQRSRLQTAIWELGGLSIGINMPGSAMTQFNAGQYWDVVADDGGNDGGHCTYVCGYNAVGYQLWTWNKLWFMTYAFWDKYVEEAWAVISQDWVNRASGKDPDGVDIVTLGAEFQAITGTNPFPAPAPPAPSPPAALSLAPAPAREGALGRMLRALRRNW